MDRLAMELNWIQLGSLPCLWPWRLAGMLGAVSQGHRGRGLLWAQAAAVDVLRLLGCSRLILVDHLTQSFGEEEVSPDGEEALCRGTGRTIALICVVPWRLKFSQSLWPWGFLKSRGESKQASKQQSGSPILVSGRLNKRLEYRMNIQGRLPAGGDSQLRSERLVGVMGVC